MGEQLGATRTIVFERGTGNPHLLGTAVFVSLVRTAVNLALLVAGKTRLTCPPAVTRHFKRHVTVTSVSSLEGAFANVMAACLTPVHALLL